MPKAFSAHLSMTSESLPPENSSVGRSKAAPVLDVPTLVLHGAADGANHPDTSLGREALFRGPYERRLLTGVGHFPQREAPAQVLAALLHFFETPAAALD